jgi:anti-sigma B factor antagonist
MDIPNGTPSVPFSALVQEIGGIQAVKIFGEVCLATSGRLEEALKQAISRVRGDNGVLVLDLTEASFMDSEGLVTVFRSTRAFREGGGEVRVAARERGPVTRLLEIAGLQDHLPVYPDAASAARPDTHRRNDGP